MNIWVPSKRKLFIGSALSVLSVLVYLGAFYLVSKNINAIQSSYAESAFVVSKEDLARNLKVIATQNESTISALRNYFIAKGDEVQFIEQIESAAKSAGVKFDITSINSDTKSIKEDDLKEDITIKINIEGSWKSVISFVEKIEKLPFGTNILTINIDKPTSGKWAGFVEFVVFKEK